MATAFGLYKAKVIRALTAAGFKGNAQEFAEYLQDSFEEAQAKDPSAATWTAMIHKDLAEFKAENPHEFATQH